MSMVERVAKAMYAADPVIEGISTAFNEPAVPVAWERLNTADQTVAKAMARAAIAAMRDLTPAMEDAARAAFDDCISPEPGEGLEDYWPKPVWQAAIDAALKQEPKP